MINIMDFDGNIRVSAEVLDTNGVEFLMCIYTEIPEAYQGWNVLQHVKLLFEFERLGLLEEIKPHDLTVLLR